MSTAPGAGLPRLLTLMGSGETSPTMVKVHRSILDRLGTRPVPAVLLDTPFGFQENARELAQRAIAYFEESLQTGLAVASGLDPDSDEAPDTRFTNERLNTNIQSARYVFSGPGSPTYALRMWRDTVVPKLLIEKVSIGGAVTFASAAALTLGAFTTPVYEIYKVGEEPRWLEGLDVMRAAGLYVAVLPHYNNAEGGTHDTRFCYLGERRLRVMEDQLPDDCFVLGIDEHTSCLIDLDAGTATVGGLGVVTVRKGGHSTTFATGETVTIDSFIAAASDRTKVAKPPIATTAMDPAPPAEMSSTSPLLDIVIDAEAEFAAAVAAADAAGATAAILQLEQQIQDWSTEVFAQDEFARARSSLRTLTVQLGNLAVAGVRDPAEQIGPFVDLLVALRAQARSDRRFEQADEIRRQLLDMGIEIHDTPGATTWELNRPG